VHLSRTGAFPGHPGILCWPRCSEAAVGGPIGLVEDGDQIVLDAHGAVWTSSSSRPSSSAAAAVEAPIPRYATGVWPSTRDWSWGRTGSGHRAIGAAGSLSCIRPTGSHRHVVVRVRRATHRHGRCLRAARCSATLIPMSQTTASYLYLERGTVCGSALRPPRRGGRFVFWHRRTASSDQPNTAYPPTDPTNESER